MTPLEVSVERVIELVKQLPPDGKQAVLNALSVEREAWWEEMLTEGEQQMRRLCLELGLDWNSMSEDEREGFVDELLHEDK
ncbi:hypothetical protein HYR99_04845 [Candidatus Poribacteria bacterium]|nr:hypothetical protein [Candidatus Poribacteria bacterium]